VDPIAQTNELEDTFATFSPDQKWDTNTQEVAIVRVETVRNQQFLMSTNSESIYLL